MGPLISRLNCLESSFLNLAIPAAYRTEVLTLSLRSIWMIKASLIVSLRRGFSAAPQPVSEPLGIIGLTPPLVKDASGPDDKEATRNGESDHSLHWRFPRCREKPLHCGLQRLNS